MLFKNKYICKGIRYVNGKLGRIVVPLVISYDRKGRCFDLGKELS